MFGGSFHAREVEYSPAPWYQVRVFQYLAPVNIRALGRIHPKALVKVEYLPVIRYSIVLPVRKCETPSVSLACVSLPMRVQYPLPRSSFELCQIPPGSDSGTLRSAAFKSHSELCATCPQM
jgi:hypothetical protein